MRRAGRAGGEVSRLMVADTGPAAARIVPRPAEQCGSVAAAFGQDRVSRRSRIAWLRCGVSPWPAAMLDRAIGALDAWRTDDPILPLGCGCPLPHLGSCACVVETIGWSSYAKGRPWLHALALAQHRVRVRSGYCCPVESINPSSRIAAHAPSSGVGSVVGRPRLAAA